MARYVGDLTEPKNKKEREKAAKVVEAIAEAIRDRRVRHFNVDYHRAVVPQGLGVPPKVSLWSIGVEVTTTKGRHER
jgi:hypothetical protein